MEYFLLCFVSFLIGWNISENYTRWKLKRYVTKHMDKTAGEPNYHRVHIRIEKKDETFIAYMTETGEFLAQSTSAKELVALLKEYFNDQVTNLVVTEGLEHIAKYAK